MKVQWIQTFWKFASAKTESEMASHYCGGSRKTFLFNNNIFVIFRHRKNVTKSQEAFVLLKDNNDLQNFLQNCQEVRILNFELATTANLEWVCAYAFSPQERPLFWLMPVIDDFIVWG